MREERMEFDRLQALIDSGLEPMDRPPTAPPGWP
jgi:hypothetical protein